MVQEEFRDLYALNPQHGVMLTERVSDGRRFVRKALTVYRADVYRYMEAHPIAGIPRIACLQEEGGVLTVTEEYVEGTTLQDMLDEGRVFTDAEVSALTAALCRVLDRLHHAEPPIIHRDIKPSNVMLADDGTLFLLDLNAAKPAEPGKAADTELLGTVGYAAPEQYGFGPSGPATDLYAVGALMNQLLTGELPPNRRAEGPLAPIIEVCTRLKPEERYPSAEALLQALEHPASPAPRPRPLWREFLPPGFRSGKVWKMAIAIPVYLIAALFIASLTLDDPLPAEIIGLKVFTSFWFYTTLLFAANGFGIWEKLRIPRIRSPLLRILAVFGGTAAVGVVDVILLLVIRTLLEF